MKLVSLLSVSALLNGVFAATCGQRTTKRDSSTQEHHKYENSRQLYFLRLKSNTPSLDKDYLSIHSKAVGVFNDGSNTTAVRVTTTAVGENSDDTTGLTPYPIGIVEHALGVIGTNGYLEFQDLTQPSGRVARPGETYSYKDFTLGDEDDKGRRELLYKDVKPGWIASPVGEDQWKIKNYDGDVVVIQNYIPVRIFLEPIQEESKPNEEDESS